MARCDTRGGLVDGGRRRGWRERVGSRRSADRIPRLANGVLGERSAGPDSAGDRRVRLRRAPRVRRRSLDLPGAIAITGALGLLVYGLTSVGEPGSLRLAAILRYSAQLRCSFFCADTCDSSRIRSFPHDC